MSIKIVETFKINEVLNSYDQFFIKNVHMSFKQFTGTIVITDIRNALKTGKDCRAFSLNVNNNSQDNCVLFNWFNRFGDDLREMFDYLCRLSWADRANQYSGIELYGFTVYDRTEKGIRTFSPFSDAMKPLKEEPKKWTLRHAMRALLNGQFESLKCNGKYTDDYAFDAATNFGSGKITNAQAFAKRIIESPGGWWVGTHRGENKISVCCHSFDSNSFIFKL